MPRLQKTVLWAVVVCVFGYLGAHVLMIKAPSVVRAQDTPAGTTRLPDNGGVTDDPKATAPVAPEDQGAPRGAPQTTEEPRVPVPEETAVTDPVTPAETLKTEDRALTAICVGDQGEPLDGVIVDIFRQSPVDVAPPPRVEGYGKTITKDGGKFSVSLPLLKGKADVREAEAMYILYFTASGRPIKSLTIANDTKLPTQIAIPTTVKERLYVPTHHLVQAKNKGVSISPMLSAPRFATKDGQFARLEEFKDQRDSGEETPATGTKNAGTFPPEDAAPRDKGSMTVPKTDSKRDLPLVAYAVRNARLADVSQVIESQFAGRFRQVARDEHHAMIMVEADADTQAEIRGVINFLDKADPPRPASGVKSMSWPAAQEQISSARQKLAAAKTDMEKQAAREQLRKLLAEIFAQDMQMREQQAAEIESRLAKLRQQYQARVKVKDEIIDLQLKVIEQDAAGLGFPGIVPASEMPSGPMRGANEQSRLPGSSVLNPMATTLDPEFLKKYSTKPQTRVGELAARGQFVGSPDGKHYAYVETKGDNIPEGTAEIRVCDARTGERFAAIKLKSPVGKLKFLNEGVATEDADGTLKLRIPFSTEHGLLDVLELRRVPFAGNEDAQQPMRSSVLPAVSGTELHSSFTSEYNALRNQYRQAKAALAAAEMHFNESVADAQEARPETTVDDVKKQLPNAVRAVERTQSDFGAAQRLLETKLELLELDRKSAMLARNAAEAKLMEVTELHRKNAATLSELNQQRTAFEAADLKVKRATTLLNFFKSISSDPEPRISTSAQGEAVSPSNDPVTLAEFGRREAVAMLQGTWNCVAASSAANAEPDQKHLSKDELVALALQLTVKDDKVTLTYCGDDLQEYQTAGKLLIDISTSPPQFHIDINVAGMQAQSRLSGAAILDRGVLRMTRPGGTFLIHRKFESEPAAFEFKRPISDSARRSPKTPSSELGRPRSNDAR